MRVTVFGRGGMVGSAMDRVLREAGYMDGDEDDPVDVVINCIGSVPERNDDPSHMIFTNAALPHKQAALSESRGERYIHISTDCVFSGERGMYTENDPPDATDLYGRSKLCGEVSTPHLTLRTSVIGHGGRFGLVNWFMRQQNTAPGWTRAYWSGLTNFELARVVRDYVLPRPDLHGLYHVAGERTTKCELLRLIARVYGLPVTVEPVPGHEIDRSLDASRFQAATGYQPPALVDMVEDMHRAYLAQ